jgi:NTE family protein
VALRVMRFPWPWWIAKPRLGVVLGGGATLGAFEVGVIDVMARRGIVPDFIVGTSVGAINAAFWATNPDPSAGERLLQLWMECSGSTMFPDGPIPMVGRLFQRKNHLTTQRGLAATLRRGLLEGATIERSKVPLAIVATDALRGERVVLRRGRLLPAVLASAAIPGLWPAVEIDGRRLIDGGLVSNCDLQAAVDARMTDIIVVDVMGDGFHSRSLDVGQVLEAALGITARRQTELAIKAFGRGVRVAVLRRNVAGGPRFGDFSHTRFLFEDGQHAADAFLARHLGPRRSVRPGTFELAATEMAQVADSRQAAASA